MIAFTGAYLDLRTPVFVPAIKAIMPVTQSLLSTRPAAPAGPPLLDHAAAKAVAEAEAARLGWPAPVQFPWHGRAMAYTTPASRRWRAAGPTC